MADIKGQLIKNSYNYVLQSDLITGIVYRIGGDVPANPKFISGLTVNTNFTYSNGSEVDGYVLTCDASGNATWKSVSAATPSSGVTSVTAINGLSGNATTGAIILVNTAPDQTVTISGGTNIEITGTYPDFGVNFTGSTSSTGDYLPLSGGTVTGGTIFQSGLTANTISATSINRIDYVVFNTGTTSAATAPGTIYFDNVEKALSYNTSINQEVTVNLGQQSYLRVFNNSGLDIERGKVVSILSAYSGLPAVTLSINKQENGNDVIGISSELIPNNSEGIVLTYGIISNINVTGASVGSLVYASDTVPGEFKNATEFLAFPLTARTNVVGYIIKTGSTDGKIFVNTVNENNNLSLTDLQRNVLEGNVISTGVFGFSGITLASTTTFNVGAAEAWIVDNTTDPLKPMVKYIKYSGQTNIPSLYYNTATETYLLLTSAGTLTQQTTFPTPQQRRENVYLGKMGHGNKTSLINAFNEPDVDISPISQLRDMFTPIKLINENVYPSAHTGLTFSTSSGTLWGLGIGFVTDQLNPSSLEVTANTITTFQYRTQTGGTATNRTTIDPANYDLNGVITAIGSPAKQATNQRIYLLQNGQFRLQYGQTKYADLTSAIAAVTTEVFTTFSNFRDNAILIGILSIRSDATLLTDPLQAKITFASKFGESVGGTGGISTTTLQQAYDNSTDPEILINSTLGGVSIKNGTGNADNVSQLLQGQNVSGATTSFIRADGLISASTLSTIGFTANTGGLTALTISATTYLNLPTDVFVTGGTYSAGTTTFTNNTGGTFNVTGFYTGTTDVFVTGGTYSSGDTTITFTNNTGGTFTVTGITSGGGSGTSVTGGTFNYTTNTLTLNNSDETSVNITGLTDTYVTGGTYTSGNAIFTNNTGGTFTVTGFAVGSGGGQLFYLNLSETKNGNRYLSTTASTAAEQSTGVTINNGVTATIASFQSDQLNITLIPGGIWSFYLHSYKQNNNAIFNIFVEVYKRTSGGTETLLFTTDPTAVTSNSPNPTMQLTDGYFSGSPILVSDSIVAVVRATNTGNQSHVITLFSEGSQHYSYAVSTLQTQQGLTCDTLSGCSVIQTIQTDISNKFDKSGGTITGDVLVQNGLTATTISATTYQGLPLTNKGDIFTFSTVNTRLGVGANGTILIADSAATTGNKWVALSGDVTINTSGVTTIKSSVAASSNLFNYYNFI